MRLPVIALRNLARNRRRTLLSLLIVACGSAGLVVTAGFIRFSFQGLETTLIHGGLGHLEVLAAGSPTTATERSGVPDMEDWEALRAGVEAVPHVRAASGTIHLTGIVSRGERSAAFLALGTEPDRERRMGFEVKVRSGADLPPERPAEGDDRVLLGTGLARSLGAGPGDIVTLLAMTAGGTLNAMDMTVDGIVTTGLQDLDGRLLKLHLVSAQRLVESERVSSIVVTLHDTRDLATASAAITTHLAGHKPALSVLDWQARAPFYSQVRGLYTGIFWFLGGIIFLLVCLSASNTLLMSVMERVREIGTLLALGTSRRQVGLLILMEAQWLGLIGALLGGLVGLAISRAIDAAGVEMPPPPGAVDPIPLHLALTPGDLGSTVILMILVLSVAAVVPLARALRLRIVDALGHV